MKKKIKWNRIGWAIIYIIIIVNLVLLFYLKKSAFITKPLKNIDIKKPTLVVIFNEFECATCVRDLFFLNDLYNNKIKREGLIEFVGIVLSKDKTDRKGIAEAFVFPVQISGDFDILKRLNMNKTPIILGITVEHRIYFCDIVPMETGVTEEFIKKGVLDRLYYSLN